MNIVNNTSNPYQDITAYQRKDILPVIKPENPIYPEKPINAKLELSPEDELKMQHAKEEAARKAEEEKEEKIAKLKALMAQYTKEQSIKSQIEIYLSVATDSDVDMGNDSNILDILRDIQDQNNSMHGYETYQELQENKEDFFTT